MKKCKVCENEFEWISQSKRCRVCEYKSGHKIVVNSLWSLEEQEIILDLILNNKITTLDEIVPKIKNKTLEQLINLLETDLKIGNRPLSVLLNCSCCGKEIIRVKRFLKHDRVYCDMKCREDYAKAHKTKQGENNPTYNSVETTCSHCGKVFKVPKYRLYLVNKDGKNNLFCSRECYSNFRSVYYVGENGANYGNKMNEEQIEANRQRTLQRIASGQIPQTLTKPHKKVNEFLDKIGIEYINEKIYKYYAIDISLERENLLIEVMGDYFHSSPLKYKLEDLNSMQLKGKKRDKSKRAYMKKYHNINMLYLWEIDINKNEELCSQLIKLYVDNKGVLEDYNSFNYFLEEGKLKLKEEITQPYFI